MKKTDYDKILYRLVDMLGRFNDGQRLSAREMAEEYAVSVRTVQRDIARLSERFGIGKFGNKYGFDGTRAVSRQLLPQDTIVIEVLEQFAKDCGEEFARHTSALFNRISSNKERIFIKNLAQDIDVNSSDLLLLYEAISTNKIVTAIYSIDGSEFDIKFAPLKIANFNNFWYAISMKFGNNSGVRTYYLNNIKNVQICTEKFIPNDDLNSALENSINIWFKPEITPFEVRLLIAPQVAKYFTRQRLSKTQRTIATHEDGSVEIALKITDEMEILPIIKSYIPFVRPLAPKSLRDRLNSEVLEYIKSENLE